MAKVKVSKNDLWRASRKMCLADVGGSPEEVRLCTCPKCPLYAFRFGRPLKDTDTVYLGNGQYGMVWVVSKASTMISNTHTKGVSSAKF
jgi:hypothetical protein